MVSDGFNLHPYNTVFCHLRTAALYTTFLALVGWSKLQGL